MLLLMIELCFWIEELRVVSELVYWVSELLIELGNEAVVKVCWEFWEYLMLMVTSVFMMFEEHDDQDEEFFYDLGFGWICFDGGYLLMKESDTRPLLERVDCER